MKDEIKPIFSTKVKPTFWNVFYASFIATFILNPFAITTLFTIFIVTISILNILIIKTDNFIGTIIITLITFLIGIPAFLMIFIFSTILKILLYKRLFLSEIVVNFYENYFTTQRQGFEIKVEYGSIKSTKKLGNYFFLRTNISVNFIFTNDPAEMQKICDIFREKGLKI